MRAHAYQAAIFTARLPLQLYCSDKLLAKRKAQCVRSERYREKMRITLSRRKSGTGELLTSSTLNLDFNVSMFARDRELALLVKKDQVAGAIRGVIEFNG